MRALALVLASALAFAPASSALAQGHHHHAPAPKPLAQSLTGHAKADYEAAKLLLENSDFASAAIKFQSAYDASKDPRLLWNVAACQKALRHYAKTIAILTRYKSEAANVDTQKRLADADELIGTLKDFTVKVTFHVEPDGADVEVDGESIGTTPLAAPAILDIGERHVRVTKDGYVPFEKTVPIGGAEATIDAKLEKQVHEGHLIVNAPAGASVFVDDKPVGTGKVDLTVASGGHQLRITAPGMRPYQSEVVVQDKESRSVDVTLDAVELPRVHVAVGCGDSTPTGPDQGLTAYLDGADVLPSSGVKRTFDPQKNDNVLRYTEYPVAPGKHTLVLREKGCVADQTAITVDPANGDDVEGALRIDEPLMFRGPQGSPAWGRVGLAFWMPTLVGSYTGGPDEYGGKAGDMEGISGDVGVFSRWFELDALVGWASGSLSRKTFNSNYALPSSPTSSATRGAIRLGPRFPFNVASLGFGVEGGLQQINVDGVHTGGIEPMGGAWAEVVVQPFCTFGFFAMGDATIGAQPDNANDGGGPIGMISLQIGSMFQPSGACRRERTTEFGLREKPKAVVAPPPVLPSTPAPAAPASTPAAPPPSPAAAPPVPAR